ncbi:MAG: PQQ-binding-like beta-propeller repeat protein [Novosphingobium sp.]|nr:PQQ-binding-like beta-propeller repeat protein [Novosphingobium sp.]
MCGATSASADDMLNKALGLASGEEFAAGEAIYGQQCASCHDGGDPRAPSRFVLQQMRPDHIRQQLIDGTMQAQGSALADDEKTEVAEYLSARKIGAETASAAPKMCKGGATQFDMDAPPAFAGWGLDPANSHSLSNEQAGITRANVGSLKLKWAFGLPETSRVRSQPSFAGGSLMFGTPTGTVYALDEETGCVRWTFAADAEVRTSVVVAPWQAGDQAAAPLAYFGDLVGNVYAVEAATGKPVWKISGDEHPAARVTGSPVFAGGTLFVVFSSFEESSTTNPFYPCCTFRGSVLALDPATGAEKWRRFLIEEPVPTGTSENGTAMHGPAGAPVWAVPAYDEARGQLYIATGNNYASPTTDMSNAVLALNAATGAIKWSYQATEGDAWNVACVFKQMSPSCPEEDGPDFDFGSGPVLAKDRTGRELVLAGQKAGFAYALDPDTGKLAWKKRIGRGGVSGGILFGIAAANGVVFVPVSDMPDGKDHGFPDSPGLYAVDIASGTTVWSAITPGDCGGDRKDCQGGHSGAVMATPELVIAGADDAYLRIHDAADGKVLWSFDTMRDFNTVNGVAARGGAISGAAAPIALNGKLYVSSGYGFASKMGGNALLVFEVE